MTIEIRRPELEALIQERLASGQFQNVEDVLMQALQAAPATPAKPERKTFTQFLRESPLWGSGLDFDRKDRTGADLIQVMQASPHQEIEIEPTRPHLPVRDVTL